MKRILIAPNAFKNSLPADEAANAIRDGLIDSGLPAQLETFPVGDGGDGTGALLIKKMNGKMLTTLASDPLKRKINTRIGLIDNQQTAVIEMADVSGLRLLSQEEKDPLRASSFGTGELIRFSLDQQVKKIILCIGGSAMVDGGCGMLRALGARFLDSAGNEIPDLPSALGQMHSIDLTGLDPRIAATPITVFCDVDNPLLGPNGAATVFGPQKGANPAMVHQLESFLKAFNALTLNQTGINMQALRHGGAAGGMAATLSAFLKATLASGIDQFLEITGFDESLERSDLLITGEGSIDRQTLEGKAPFGVAQRAKKREIPVIALAGSIPSEADAALARWFDVLLAIGQRPESLGEALMHAATSLRYTAAQLGRMLMLSGKMTAFNK